MQFAMNNLLEAFGNAKTIAVKPQNDKLLSVDVFLCTSRVVCSLSQNGNSSRFGKYIELQCGPGYTVRSACSHHYLLEKSRVVRQVSKGTCFSHPGDKRAKFSRVLLLPRWRWERCAEVAWYRQKCGRIQLP